MAIKAVQSEMSMLHGFNKDKDPSSLLRYCLSKSCSAQHCHDKNIMVRTGDAFFKYQLMTDAMVTGKRHFIISLHLAVNRTHESGSQFEFLEIL